MTALRSLHKQEIVLLSKLDWLNREYFLIIPHIYHYDPGSVERWIFITAEKTINSQIDKIWKEVSVVRMEIKRKSKPSEGWIIVGPSFAAVLIIVGIAFCVSGGWWAILGGLVFCLAAAFLTKGAVEFVKDTPL